MLNFKLKLKKEIKWNKLKKDSRISKQVCHYLPPGIDTFYDQWIDCQIEKNVTVTYL